MFYDYFMMFIFFAVCNLLYSIYVLFSNCRMLVCRGFSCGAFCVGLLLMVVLSCCLRVRRCAQCEADGITLGRSGSLRPDRQPKIPMHLHALFTR